MNDTRLTPAVEPSDEEIDKLLYDTGWTLEVAAHNLRPLVRAALARFASVQKYDPSAVERLIEVGTNALDLIRWINTQATDLAGIVTIDVENDLLAALAALRGEEDGR